MRDRPIVGALIFDGEIVDLLPGRCAGAGEPRSVETDRALVAENFEAVDLGGGLPSRSKAGEDRTRGAVVGLELERRAVLANELVARSGQPRRRHPQCSE